tara:strand:- start:1525 stop:1713 length:189 start_codon:yes stop_codon:yes gene_type:complete
MSKVLIHCKHSLQEFLFKNDFDYVKNDEEIDVLVDNIDSLDDEEFCQHYGIDYDQVNCIELV